VPPTHQPDFVLGPHGVASAVNRHDSLFEVDRRSSTRADKATVVSLLLLLDRRLCSGCGRSQAAHELPASVIKLNLTPETGSA
jgi:hypothetical protein